MKRIILAAAFGLFATSAFAIENGDPFSTGDGNGPHQPRAVTSYDYPGDADQIAANKAWRKAAFERANEVGVWGDGILPPEYAAQAWNGAGSGRNPNPTGGAIGAGQSAGD